MDWPSSSKTIAVSAARMPLPMRLTSRCVGSRSILSCWIFSDGYYNATQSMAVAAGSDITGFDGLEGLSVAVKIGTQSKDYADELAETYDIATRAGAHCAPRMHRALGTEEQGAVRFSFGFYNTEQETDAAIRAVQELAAT